VNVATRPFGDTGLRAPVLGFGTGRIGGDDVTEAEASAVLHRALDLGLTLIDSARSYGRAEARIGRHLSARRDAFILVTKVGYGIAGHEDWTGSSIRAGIDEALALFRTDRIDVVLLHSCPAAVLARDDIEAALEDAVRAGKARFVGYSGENEDLDAAMGRPWCRVIETSVNLYDQRGLERAVRRASARAIAVIAKRPLANAPWRFSSRPTGHYAEPYWERMGRMDLRDLGDLDETAIRFAAHAPGVSTAIVGTSSLAHLERAASAASKGPLDDPIWHRVRDAFRVAGADWRGLV
jgi:aryl-alcohol dehydrogenase-like predicted oxidoreductase